MKLIKGLVCPPGVEHVEMFASGLSDGRSLYSVCARMEGQETFSGPHYYSSQETRDMWNNMFASTDS